MSVRARAGRARARGSVSCRIRPSPCMLVRVCPHCVPLGARPCPPASTRGPCPFVSLRVRPCQMNHVTMSVQPCPGLLDAANVANAANAVAQGIAPELHHRRFRHRASPSRRHRADFPTVHPQVLPTVHPPPRTRTSNITLTIMRAIAAVLQFCTPRTRRHSGTCACAGVASILWTPLAVAVAAMAETHVRVCTQTEMHVP